MELFVRRDPTDFGQNDTDSENDSDCELGDNESVDIVSSLPEHICNNNSVNVNKFSIDNLLGLKTQTEERLNFCNSKCEKNKSADSEFIKPSYSASRTASLYQSIIDLPQLSNSEELSIDSRLSHTFSVPKLSLGHESSSNTQPFPISFHPPFSANSSTLLYGSWVGATSEHKSNSQIFGLQDSLNMICGAVVLMWLNLATNFQQQNKICTRPVKSYS